MIALQVAALLYGLWVLVRHGPVLFRRPAGAAAPGARVVAALNVVIALVIMGIAVKALLSALI